MDKRYFEYCRTDRCFYDAPAEPSAGEGFAVARRALPPGWRSRVADGWLSYAPDGVTLPAQGWKIHASATMDNADEVLGVLWDYCVPRRIAFKHLTGPRAQLANNSKYASRGSSAKLATVYPADERRFARILAELGPLLDGQPGAYILSDLRWGDGPLHVRYGGFAKRYATFDRGEPEPAIEDAGGRLVPDRREPAFRTPPWVTLPACLAPHLAARNAVTVADLPYRIDRALHFSNGGGVYLGTHVQDGTQVVLKEARPHAGLDMAGADAVSRLRRERTILTHLDGLDFVPRVLDHFLVGEHHFLVQEWMGAQTLNKERSQRIPLYGPAAGEAALRDYVDWAVAVIDRVERNLAALWERGVVFGDLHMHNILIGADGRLPMIDFEVAAFRGEDHRPALGNPAFLAPADRRGVEVDRYSLACLRFAMFLPMTTLFALDPGKVHRLAAEIPRLFPTPAGYFDEAVATVSGGAPPPRRTFDTGTFWGRPDPAAPAADPWAATRSSMVAAILASATPERDDRLFPGDIAQFDEGGGLNLASGAAGVLYALSVAGAGRFPGHERWLLDHLRRPGPGGRIGFYDGLHGVAYALEHLGHRTEALDLLDRCQRAPWRRLGPGLSGGLAGIGLNLRHFATVTGDAGLRDAAAEVAATVAARLGPVDAVATTSGGKHPHAGLLHGSAGPALLFIRMFEATGDGGYLDLAATALDQDLRRCVRHANGSLQVDEGWRLMPYLGTGSAGIGAVLQEFLRHRRAERHLDALAAITLAAGAGFYGQSGIFTGRAGILLFHCGPRPHRPEAVPAVIARQVRALGLHRMDFHGRVAFPGDQLYRLSMDLGTGTAGVLVALARAAGLPAAGLPFHRYRDGPGTPYPPGGGD
ncbi:class III lanthionine synthetase LanKC [Actinoplanes subtropicus]|uniref:class III lanthionine synthetase LanKC n=1 Tax=Actinoplanes subtropicus TaxID=543632 RepID=UPI00068F8A70|nr:class III lanthionine synthetase LanKC [Actinoplanes subtropicus]